LPIYPDLWSGLPQVRQDSFGQAAGSYRTTRHFQEDHSKPEILSREIHTAPLPALAGRDLLRAVAAACDLRLERAVGVLAALKSLKSPYRGASLPFSRITRVFF